MRVQAKKINNGQLCICIELDTLCDVTEIIQKSIAFIKNYKFSNSKTSVIKAIHYQLYNSDDAAREVQINVIFIKPQTKINDVLYLLGLEQQLYYCLEERLKPRELDLTNPLHQLFIYFNVRYLPNGTDQLKEKDYLAKKMKVALSDPLLENVLSFMHATKEERIQYLKTIPSLTSLALNAICRNMFFKPRYAEQVLAVRDAIPYELQDRIAMANAQQRYATSNSFLRSFFNPALNQSDALKILPINSHLLFSLKDNSLYLDPLTGGFREVYQIVDEVIHFALVNMDNQLLEFAFEVIYKQSKKNTHWNSTILTHLANQLEYAGQNKIAQVEVIQASDLSFYIPLGYGQLKMALLLALKTVSAMNIYIYLYDYIIERQCGNFCLNLLNTIFATIKLDKHNNNRKEDELVHSGNKRQLYSFVDKQIKRQRLLPENNI